MAKQPPRLEIRNKYDTAIQSERQETRLDKRSLRDRRVNFWLVTQIITPARPKKAMERMARTAFFLPENAYVRNIRITEDIADTGVNNSCKAQGLIRTYIVLTISVIKL